MKIIFFKTVCTSALLLGLITCKKYPENTLWFKNPFNIDLMPGHITSYKVNGIDSLEFLNLYYKSVMPNSYFPYNLTNRNIKTEDIRTRNTSKKTNDIDTQLGTGHVNWNDKKKSVYISFRPDTMYYKKNLFLLREGLDWDIIYLDKKGVKTKIKTTYNNKTYEITFEK